MKVKLIDIFMVGPSEKFDEVYIPNQLVIGKLIFTNSFQFIDFILISFYSHFVYIFWNI